MMLGEEVPKSLTAWHTREFTQEISVRMPTPEGTDSDVQLAPESTVPMMTGLPKIPNPTAVQAVVVGHEIALRPLTSAGNDWAVQAYPSLTEDRTELTPTAKQSAVVGHETEFNCPVPAGGACDVQDNPPVVVPIIIEPAPAFPVVPTAMQSSAEEHEIPVSSTASVGGLWDVHVDPLSEVPTAYGVELKFVPTPIQVVSFGQTTPDRRDPIGIEVVVVQLLKSTVLRLVGPPALAIPTATQVNDPAHEMPVNMFTAGWSRSVHVVPSWVPMIDGREAITPTATQVRASGQETLAREFSPAGGFWEFQPTPSSVCSMPRPPTAVHSSMVKQEIDSAGKDESSMVQFVPPSVDFRIPEPPPA